MSFQRLLFILEPLFYSHKHVHIRWTEFMPHWMHFQFCPLIQCNLQNLEHLWSRAKFWRYLQGLKSSYTIKKILLNASRDNPQNLTWILNSFKILCLLPYRWFTSELLIANYTWNKPGSWPWAILTWLHLQTHEAQI